MDTSASTDPPEGGEADHPEEHDQLLLAMARARGVTPSNSKTDDPPPMVTMPDGRRVRAPRGSGPHARA